MPYPEARFATRPSNSLITSDLIHPFEIVTNSLGLRDREYGAKAPGVFRILVLGDSFTMGWGLEAQDTFPKRLDRLMRERFPRRDFEVMNMGTSGYGPYQERIVFHDRGLALEPDLVIQQFYSGNDLADELIRDSMMPESFPYNMLWTDKITIDTEPWRWEFSLGQRMKSVVYAGETFRQWRAAQFRRERLPSARLDFAAPTGRPDWAEPCRIDTPPRIARAWNMVAETTKKLANECAAREIDYFALEIPDEFEVYPVPLKPWTEPYRLENPHEYDLGLATARFEALFREADVPYLCLQPLFVAKKESGSGDLYIPMNRHLNAEGHQVTAEVVFDTLMRSPTPRLAAYLNGAKPAPSPISVSTSP